MKALLSASFIFVAICLAAWPDAKAAPITYSATLTGPSESPPNPSPGIGSALVTYDPALHTLGVNVSFSGLLAVTTASHIHAPTLVPLTGTAGVATTTPTFAGFPLGVTSGTYSNVLNLTLASSFNPAFVTANGGTVAGAEAALASALASGQSYLNIHTTQFPSGEIRGFLVATPEPASVAVWLAAGLIVGTAAHRRRRTAARA